MHLNFLICKTDDENTDFIRLCERKELIYVKCLKARTQCPIIESYEKRKWGGAGRREKGERKGL